MSLLKKDEELRLEIAKKEGRIRELTDRISRYSQNEQKNKANYERGGKELLDLNQKKLALSKELTAGEEKIKNIEYTVKVAVEKANKAIEAKSDELKVVEAKIIEEQKRVDAKLAKAEELYLSAQNKDRDYSARLSRLKEKEVALNNADVKLVELNALKEELRKEQQSIDNRFAIMQNQEVALETKEKRSIKREGLISSKEADVNARMGAANLSLEKYRFAANAMNEEQQKLKKELGAIIIREDKANKQMLDAETLLASARHKEKEVLGQWARIRKTINDKNLDDLISGKKS